MLKKNITNENVKLNQTAILDKIDGKFLPIHTYILTYIHTYIHFIVFEVKVQ